MQNHLPQISDYCGKSSLKYTFQITFACNIYIFFLKINIQVYVPSQFLLILSYLKRYLLQNDVRKNGAMNTLQLRMCFKPTFSLNLSCPHTQVLGQCLVSLLEAELGQHTISEVFWLQLLFVVIRHHVKQKSDRISTQKYVLNECIK